MLERSITHLLWLFQYLIPVILAGIHLIFVALPNDQGFEAVIWFLLGAYLGNIVLIVDSVWLYPKYNELRTVPQKLISRSLIFLIAYIITALFVVTTSASSLGIGLVLGIGFSLWGEMLAYLLTQPQFFAQRYFFQLKRTASLAEQHGFVIGFGLMMLGLAIFGLG